VAEDAAAGSVVYLDSSALVKLVVPEPESEALELELHSWTDGASSSLAWVELPRAVRRRLGEAGPSLLELWGALAASAEVPVSDEVIGIAARLDPTRLGSLDAIHLASAISLGDAVGALITYDDVLESAAQDAGLRTLRPA
jgi:predicted nucleic acid-binding protein